MREVTKENLTAQIDRLYRIKEEQGQLSMNNEYTLQAYEMLLATMNTEPVEWLNGCNKTIPAALRYLAENPRPIGGESSFNTAHLYQLAREIELMAEAPIYRHAQQPVVPRVTCWSCRNQVEISAIGDCDGYCPECDAPIDLDEDPYTSEQPAPVAPEEMTPQQASRSYGGEVRGYRDGWNACRAVMLNQK